MDDKKNYCCRRQVYFCDSPMWGQCKYYESGGRDPLGLVCRYYYDGRGMECHNQKAQDNVTIWRGQNDKL